MSMLRNGLRRKLNNMKFITNNQLVGCKVIKEKKFLFWNFVLVQYAIDWYNCGQYLYSDSNRVKWILKSKLIN